MSLKSIGIATEIGWALAIGAGIWFAVDHRWPEAGLSLAVFLIGRSLDLVIARLGTEDDAPR